MKIYNRSEFNLSISCIIAFIFYASIFAALISIQNNYVDDTARCVALCVIEEMIIWITMYLISKLTAYALCDVDEEPLYPFFRNFQKTYNVYEKNKYYIYYNNKYEIFYYKIPLFKFYLGGFDTKEQALNFVTHEYNKRLQYLEQQKTHNENNLEHEINKTKINNQLTQINKHINVII